MYHLSIPQLTAFFLFFCVRFIALKDKKPPRGEGTGWKQGFYNLASGAASVGSILLDYARDAPALNLISFNICLRVLS